jgi:hypothetical protein
MNDRDRATPIALPRNAPILQPEPHLPLAHRPAVERFRFQLSATFWNASAVESPSRKRELIIVPSPSTA